VNDSATAPVFSSGAGSIERGSALAEIWLRPWALVEAKRLHRISVNSDDIEVGPLHAAALWLYEPSDQRVKVNGRSNVTELIPGFDPEGDKRRLSLIPFPLRKNNKITVAVDDNNVHINWSGAPERPSSKLDPQTDAEKESHRLMLRAEAVWDRLRDVETALADPAQLWPELRRRWTNEGDDLPPSMDAIVKHAFALWRTIDELGRAPRRNLRRTHRMVAVSRIQELDRRAMTWLVRQPGESLAERAGDQQRILAVAREDNFDTLENRVLRAYSDLATHIVTDYMELNNAKRSTSRARKVEAFGRATRRLSKQLAEQGVRLAEPGLTPNFVLQHNVHYHKVWTSWQELLKRDRVLDELWQWQARSWEEYCALAVVVAIVGIPGARLIAAAPLEFLQEQNRGCWTTSDNPLATFYLSEQKLVVEVRYRMRMPDRRLSDFAAPIWVRVGRTGDIIGFLRNIAIWPIWDIRGGVVDGEVEELEQVLSLGAKAHLTAAIVLRPSQQEVGMEIRKTARILTLAIGTSGPALWQSLGELTHFLATTTDLKGQQ
jgi:hypothetical protein